MRTFIAVNLPPAVRRSVFRAMSPFREANLPVRWVGEDALHITVAFLGEIDDSSSTVVQSIMADVAGRFGRHTLRMGNTGVFPSARRPDVWWVGCTAPRLIELHAALQRELQRIGFEPEHKKFVPHVTVGRTRRVGRGSRTAAIDASAFLRARVDEEVSVESLDLMRSHLSHAGSRYERIAAVSLQGAS